MLNFISNHATFSTLESFTLSHNPQTLDIYILRNGLLLYSLGVYGIATNNTS